MTIDTSPEALAALRERLPLTISRDLLLHAADVIDALEKERDAAVQNARGNWFDAEQLAQKLKEVEAERDALLTLLESDAPMGRKITNAQYVEVTSRLREERDAALAALRNVYEVYAGMEGIPVPETAPEAYLLRLVHQMKDAALAEVKHED